MCEALLFFFKKNKSERIYMYCTANFLRIHCKLSEEMSKHVGVHRNIDIQSGFPMVICMPVAPVAQR